MTRENGDVCDRRKKGPRELPPRHIERVIGYEKRVRRMLRELATPVV